MPTVTEDKKALTSLRVFRKFIVRETKVLEDGSTVETLNAAGITSRECYDMWLQARKGAPAHPEKAFQRSLSAHLGAVDGRLPFTPREEAAILDVIRRKTEWPCFQGTTETRYGLMGYRAKGFHEKRRENGANDLPHTEEEYEEPDSNGNGLADLAHEDEEGRGARKSRKKSMLSKRNTSESVPKRLRTTQRAKSFGENSSSSSVPGSDDASGEDVEFNFPLSFAATRFWNMAKMVLANLYHTPLDVWDTLLNLRRMTSLACGVFPHFNLEKATEVFESECLKYPGTAIVIINPSAVPTKNRCIMATPEFEDWMGPITAAKGGITRRLFPRSEIWGMLKNLIRVWSHPNEEITLDLFVTDKRMVAGRTRFLVRTYPPYGFVVVRGYRLSSGGQVDQDYFAAAAAAAEAEEDDNENRPVSGEGPLFKYDSDS